MKHALAFIFVVASLIASEPLKPGDKLPIIKTTKGKVYEQVEVKEITDSTLKVKHKDGIAALWIKELAPELQALCHFDAERAVADEKRRRENEWIGNATAAKKRVDQFRAQNELYARQVKENAEQYAAAVAAAAAAESGGVTSTQSSSHTVEGVVAAFAQVQWPYDEKMQKWECEHQLESYDTIQTIKNEGYPGVPKYVVNRAIRSAMDQYAPDYAMVLIEIKVQCKAHLGLR